VPFAIFQISKEDIDFQHYKEPADLEALEEANAYPPRFFLTFRNSIALQTLSACITVRIGKQRPKRNDEILEFPVNTLDYHDFLTGVSEVPPDQTGIQLYLFKKCKI